VKSKIYQDCEFMMLQNCVSILFLLGCWNSCQISRDISWQEIICSI